MNLNDKRFVTVENNHGLSSAETIFHYFQNGMTITGKYKGGAILEGFIVGKQTGEGKIALLFQCLTTEGELKVGESKGTILKYDDGKLGLKFDWKWLNGELSRGKSEYIEMK